MYIPFVRQNKLKPDNITTFSINHFNGGINNVMNPTQIEDNEAQDILNYSMKLEQKRTGVELYDEVNLGKEIVYMGLYSPINKEEVLIRATEELIYADDEIIADVEGKIQGVSYIDNYYFVDGKNFYQYDGNKVYQIVSYPFARLSSAVTTGATELILDTWDERLANGVKGQLEDIAHKLEFTIDVIDKTEMKITVTPALTFNFPANTYIRFYVPLGDAYYKGTWKTSETLNLKWYEPCKHELDDILKGEHLLPENCSCIAIDNDRFYISGCKDNPHEIYMSDINNPFYFPVNLGLQCPPNGDEIVDLINYDDGIIVARRNDMYIIRGTTADLSLGNVFNLHPINVHTGISSRDNAKIVNNYLFFLGTDLNVYGLNPVWGTTTLATSVINKDKIDFSKAPFGFTKEIIKNSPSIFFDDEYYFIVDDVVVVYNFIKRAWTKYMGWDATFFLIKDNSLLIGNKNGHLLKISKEYNDLDEPIECFYKTKQYNLGAPVNYKNFLDMFAVTHTFRVDNSTIKVYPIIDYDSFSTYIDITNILSKFGVMLFGEQLISSGIAQTDNVPINARGRLISFIFSNSELDEPLKVYQLSFTYILRGVR